MLESPISSLQQAGVIGGRGNGNFDPQDHVTRAECTKMIRIVMSGIMDGKLWQIHPFREGNTRTIITFATQFSQVHGFNMNKNLLRENSGYVRDALVKASDG